MLSANSAQVRSVFCQYVVPEVKNLSNFTLLLYKYFLGKKALTFLLSYCLFAYSTVSLLYFGSSRENIIIFILVMNLDFKLLSHLSSPNIFIYSVLFLVT